jgi:hypothetical protein
LQQPKTNTTHAQRLTDITHPHIDTKNDFFDIPQNTLSLYHTNICSLNTKHMAALQETHIAQFKRLPDIITLTETKLTDATNATHHTLNHYTPYHTKDISVYVKHNIHTSIMDSISMTTASTLVLRIHTNEHKTNTIHTIINIYRRPQTDPTFEQDLQAAIDDIYALHPTTTITIIGDININLLQLPTRLYNLLIENNLHTTITTPTRHDPVHTNTHTLIDTILTTATDTRVTAGTLSPPISDHLAIYTTFHKATPRKQKQQQKTLSITRYNRNKDKILHDIRETVLNTHSQTPHTATTSQHFHTIQSAMQQVIEKHEKQPKPKQRAWCTPTYKRQINKQHALHAKARHNPTPKNIQAHRKYRNKLHKDILKAKKKQLATQIDDAKHDPKLQAQILKAVLSTNKTTRTSPTTLTYNNSTTTDPQTIADNLNDHYITIGKKTTAKIPPIPPDEYISQDVPHKSPAFKLNPITETQLRDTMHDINPNKASDIYKIKPAIIKDLTDFLAPTLTTLFNRAIDENEYPDALKVTKLIELYKKKDRTLPENYRPISLLPIIAKLFDTLINKQIMHHITTHNVISSTQYAFRPNSNTTLALQTILDNIRRQTRTRKPILAIYIDLSKAYDTVEHEKLLYKLKHLYNFTDAAVAFFRSYLTNRQQSTHTQHAQSKMQTITHGIPQGSTLSTTFFLLYINNIIQTVPNSTVYTYADDTTLIVTTNTAQELQTLAQSELNQLIYYFHDNNLVPNATKTMYTVFNPTDSNLRLAVNNQQLTNTDHAKLLGITVQKNMKHKQTVASIVKKLQPAVQTFRHANKLLPRHTLKQLYYSLVYPHLIGAITVWGTAQDNKEYIQPLIRMQKKIVRLIMRQRPRTHTKPLMKQLQLHTLTSLYKLRVCAEIHPFIHKPKKAVNRPTHNHQYIPIKQIHSYPTRHSENSFFIPTYHAKHNDQQRHAHTMPHYTAEYTKIWNTTLTPALQRIKSLPTFKSQLKTHLLEVQWKD